MLGGRRLLCPECAKEFVAGAVHVFLRLGVGVEVHHLIACVGVVFRPSGQAGAVGVGVLGEVAPIFSNEVGKLVVLGAPADPVFRVERAENEFDFGGVVGAGFLGTALRVLGVVHVEAVAVDGGFAGLELRVDPSPGGEGDEAVALVVRERALRLSVVVIGIELQEFVGFRGEILCCDVFESVGGGLVFGHSGSAFVAIPAREKRDVVLLAGAEDGFG